MTPRPFLLKFLWLLFLLPVLVAYPAEAQTEQSGLTLEAQAGFDGFYKGEHWLPVSVNVANSGSPIEGEIRVYPGPNADGDFLYRAPISLPTQSDKRVSLYIQLPGPASSVLVELADAQGEVLASTRTKQLARVRLEDLLYGVITPDSGEFDFLEKVAGSRTDAAVAYLNLNDLPEISTAWNALDVLIFNDTDTTQLTADQMSALEAWLSTGGQLVVTGGASWQKTAVPLADWLPVTLNGSETVADLPGLADQARVPFRDPGPYVVTTSSLARGELLFHEDGLPILAQTGYGRGSVYFLALDPRFAPLLDWDGVDKIFAAAANRVPPLSLWGAVPSTGYSAQSAVTRLPDLNLPSVWQLAFFLILYIATVGPANYYILKRRNRLELAWVTLPVLILAFTAVTYFTGFQLRGNEAIINQLAVAYSQADGSQARVYSLVGLYSPRRSTYDVIFPADTLARPFDQLLGGFSNNPNAKSITYSSSHSIDEVRVDVSAVETFIAQTDRPALNISGAGVLNRQSASALRLEAAIQNNSEQTLASAALLFGDISVSLGDLDPGETKEISEIVTTTSSPGYGYNGPLTNHANTLLGYNYYDDAKLYPRFQFLQALEGENFGSGPTLDLPRNSAVLVGWTETAPIDIGLSKGIPDQTAVTLHFIEIPISQDLASTTSSDQELILPTLLLDWKLLPDSTASGVYPYHTELNSNWAAFEYTPPLEFHESEVTNLTLLLEKESYSSDNKPDVSLWNWETDAWDLLEIVNWGRTPVPNPQPYIGPANATRIQVFAKDTDYQVLTAVYPLLTIKGD